MASFLDRYLAGEREQVWEELLALGPGVRDVCKLADAEDVARETMARVRRNIEKLYGRLRQIDYPFTGEICDPYAPPAPDTTATLAKIEQAVGPLPLSVRAFAETVGAVDFCGGYGYLNAYRRYHPDFDGLSADTDPLVFWPIGENFESEYGEWQERIEEDGEEETGPFRLEFAPDALHKADFSGGSPYAIKLPNPSADAIVEDEPHQTTFVNYLRICFKWGGFPGFKNCSNPPGKLICMLCEGLEPI